MHNHYVSHKNLYKQLAIIVQTAYSDRYTHYLAIIHAYIVNVPRTTTTNKSVFIPPIYSHTHTHSLSFIPIPHTTYISMATLYSLHVLGSCMHTARVYTVLSIECWVDTCISCAGPLKARCQRIWDNECMPKSVNIANVYTLNIAMYLPLLLLLLCTIILLFIGLMF